MRLVAVTGRSILGAAGDDAVVGTVLVMTAKLPWNNSSLVLVVVVVDGS